MVIALSIIEFNSVYWLVNCKFINHSDTYKHTSKKLCVNNVLDHNYQNYCINISIQVIIISIIIVFVSKCIDSQLQPMYIHVASWLFMDLRVNTKILHLWYIDATDVSVEERVGDIISTQARAQQLAELPIPWVYIEDNILCMGFINYYYAYTCNREIRCNLWDRMKLFFNR